MWDFQYISNNTLAEMSTKSDERFNTLVDSFSRQQREIEQLTMQITLAKSRYDDLA